MSFKCLDISEIEDSKWERLLDKSANASFYMCLDYLKLMHPKWFILVSIKGDDYEFALPIPIKRFGFLYYGVQPSMLQRLSLLSQSESNVDEFMQFTARTLRSKLIYFRLSFDEESYNKISKYLKTEAQTHVNLYSKVTGEVQKGYSTNHKRNIQKAKKKGMQFLVDKNTKPVLEGFLREKVGVLKSSEQRFSHVNKMIEKFTSTDNLMAVHAFDGKGERVGACLMFLFRNRATFILSYSDDQGKKAGAMHGIIDHWMQGFGQKYSILDFEGGNISSLKRFYLGFGAKEELYLSTRYYNSGLKLISRLIEKYI